MTKRWVQFKKSDGSLTFLKSSEDVAARIANEEEVLAKVVEDRVAELLDELSNYEDRVIKISPLVVATQPSETGPAVTGPEFPDHLG